MKNKLMLSMLFLCSAATVSAQWDMTKLAKGNATEIKLKVMRRTFPGGGYIDPEQNLSGPDRDALSYYRQWKAEHPSAR